MLSAEECLQWSVSTLKKHLQSQGVVTTGSKENLVERMLMLSEPSSPLKFKEKVKTSKAKPATKSGKLTKDVKAKGAKVEKVKKAKPVKTVKAVKAVKAMKAVKTARAKAADDVGDLHSSVASLNGCLRKVPNVNVGKALLGPGPCLLKALPKTSALKPSTLSMQHRLAVRLYTAEEPLPLYKALNEPFHATSRSPNSITNQAPFLKIMAQAVRALAKGKALYTGPAYRGVKVAKSPLLKRKYENYSEAFKVGSRVTFAAFTSLSLADSTAESFGDRILFQFTRVRGVRIAELSAIPSELEILVEPPAVFKVTSCAKFHGVLSVVLEAVESPLRYL
ncbi:unnamed protein product [Cladocopium goreaui]|uniref:NAD(P)(+)--arginine ADP-ribosyltransferase n=1 Tax=Cladocopium goreaui TaxID=2562237 RepID=A0A9P1BU24_9DINO|nr:unnamed protein product [Cladocopium goreaui]